MTKFDLVSVGDNATDAFIKLSEAELNCDINKPECKICLRFASKIPYESVTEIPAGGNSSNVVLGATKLGLNTAYLTVVGGDENGKKTLTKLQEVGVKTDLIKTQAKTPTNYNYVLWYQDDRTILVKHEDYHYDWPEDLEAPAWLFLSSVSDPDLSLHQKITTWLNQNPETKLVFSPGTTQIKAGVENLKEIYQRTNIFFSNKQEAEKVTKKPGSEIKTLAQEIKNLGPQIVVVTDGENGAYCLDDQNNFWFISASPTEAYERTGAGDSFTSAFLSALFYQQNIDQALAWGVTNAASVVSKIGPHDGLLSREEIETQLKTSGLVAKKI